MTSQSTQAAAAAASILWISNFYFTFREISYFGDSGIENLYLHTWSLGVEEQFYLIWPLIILLISSSCFLCSIKSNLKLLFGVASLVVVSYLACLWLSYKYPISAYYLMPPRIWQFGVGALGFFINQNYNLDIRKPLVPLLGWIGITLILISAIFITEKTIYPGTAALMPTFGTLLLLVVRAIEIQGNGITTYTTGCLLSTKPFVYIGKISYSWYLWHWPALAIGHIVFNNSNLSSNLLSVLCSICIAHLSFRFIERPTRNLSLRTKNRRNWIIAISIFTMILVNSQFVSWQNKVILENAMTNVDPIYYSKFDTPAIYSLGCDDWYHSADLKPCIFGNTDADKTILIAGDSIGLQWFPAIAEIYSEESWKIIAITKSSCPLVNTPFFYSRIKREFRECTEWRQELVQYINETKPSVLVLGSSSRYEFSDQQWLQGTNQFFSQISSSSEHIYVLRPTPALEVDINACHEELRTNNPDSISHCVQPYENINSTAWEVILDITSNYGNVHTVDMNSFVCPSQTCSLYSNNLIAYRDRSHLTSTYVKSLSPQLKHQLFADLPVEPSKQRDHDKHFPSLN